MKIMNIYSRYIFKVVIISFVLCCFGALYNEPANAQEKSQNHGDVEKFSQKRLGSGSAVGVYILDEDRLVLKQTMKLRESLDSHLEEVLPSSVMKDCNKTGWIQVEQAYLVVKFGDVEGYQNHKCFPIHEGNIIYLSMKSKSDEDINLSIKLSELIAFLKVK